MIQTPDEDTRQPRVEQNQDHERQLRPKWRLAKQRVPVHILPIPAFHTSSYSRLINLHPLHASQPKHSFNQNTVQICRYPSHFHHPTSLPHRDQYHWHESSNAREPAVEGVGAKSGRQNQELQRYNSDLTAFFNGIATQILNGAPVQFNPIPINVAATVTLLPNSSSPNNARV